MSVRSGNPSARWRAQSRALHQFRYDLLVFWRNGQARFFTVLMPLIFLVIFAAVFGDGTIQVPGGQVDPKQYYVPGLATLGIVSASLVNLVITVTTQRDTGVLKRRRATPVPAWALIAGRALSCVAIAVATVAILIAVGLILYGVDLPASRVPALILVVAARSLACCSLGFALAAVFRSADRATPVVQAIVLPLYFISGVFVPSDQIPGWLLGVADAFPIRHLTVAMVDLFAPDGSLQLGHLAVVVAWGAAGLLLAVRRFKWMANT
jgi:ABC-2 type transport system permease protein